MSEENVNVQTNSNENTETNPSTETSNKNVPYDRFQEVVASKNEMAGQIGKLQAQIDKMNQDNKSKAEAKMVEDGKLKEALDIVTQERDSYKTQSEQATETFEFVKSKTAFIAAKKIEDLQQISSARKEDDHFVVRHAEEGLRRREEDRDLAEGKQDDREEPPDQDGWLRSPAGRLSSLRVLRHAIY
mgnify:CR=1 FL=1